MTEHELDRWLAINVMKWDPGTLVKPDNTEENKYHDEFSGRFIEYDDWHPTADIRQAFEPAWKVFSRIHIHKTPVGYRVFGCLLKPVSPEKWVSSEIEKTTELALCKTIYAARDITER